MKWSTPVNICTHQYYNNHRLADTYTCTPVISVDTGLSVRTFIDDCCNAIALSCKISNNFYMEQ